MPAMRSNIARTCAASSLPACTPGGGVDAIRGAPALGRAATVPLLELGQEVDDRIELLRRQALEIRHRRCRVDKRARDPLARQARGDVREIRPGPCVAVLAELVAGQAA